MFIIIVTISLCHRGVEDRRRVLRDADAGRGGGDAGRWLVKSYTTVTASHGLWLILDSHGTLSHSLSLYLVRVTLNFVHWNFAPSFSKIWSTPAGRCSSFSLASVYINVAIKMCTTKQCRCATRGFSTRKRLNGFYTKRARFQGGKLSRFLSKQSVQIPFFSISTFFFEKARKIWVLLCKFFEI